MRQIRRGIFETNSSSVHSITIVSKEDYDKWVDGKVCFDKYGKKFVDSPQNEDEDIYSFENFPGCDKYEYFEKSFTTKSGDEIVAFGYYGENR